MRHSITFTIILAITLMSACTNNKNPDHAYKTVPLKDTVVHEGITFDSNVIKVYIDRTGIITADGRLITLPVLDSSFSKLKSTHGMVYYSRDNSSQTPPPRAMDVMELITKYALPVRLYSDRTFTHIEQFD